MRFKLFIIKRLKHAFFKIQLFMFTRSLIYGLQYHKFKCIVYTQIIALSSQQRHLMDVH